MDFIVTRDEAPSFKMHIFLQMPSNTEMMPTMRWLSVVLYCVNDIEALSVCLGECRLHSGALWEEAWKGHGQRSSESLFW